MLALKAALRASSLACIRDRWLRTLGLGLGIGKRLGLGLGLGLGGVGGLGLNLGLGFALRVSGAPFLACGSALGLG